MLVRQSPLVSSAYVLLLTLAGVLLVQGAGHYLDRSWVAQSLPIAFILACAMVYGVFFRAGWSDFATLGGLLALFAVQGFLSLSMFDMTADGLGYQQPGAEALLQGWNPLRHDAPMLWQNLYPSGAWEAEAALAWLFGSIEAARMLQWWWLLIALPLWSSGLRSYLQRPLTKREYLLAGLAVASPVVWTQLLTHYVDAMIYLSGLSFVGVLLTYGGDRRQRTLCLLLMGSCVLFMVNAKLSGLYHAVVLCGAALLFVTMRTRAVPYGMAASLLFAGLLATLVLGFHPYVTNLMTYGSLLHMDGNTFSGYQRPANLSALLAPERFFASIFSATGGMPRLAAQPKLPWQILPQEWNMAGAPDSLTGGFGVWFALAMLGTFLLLALARKTAPDLPLLALAAILFASSMLFPEGWWARYVPFAYLAVLLVLLALPRHLPAPLPAIATVVVAILLANSTLAMISSYRLYHRKMGELTQLAARLRAQPAGSVYLVPPGDDYLVYNHAHMPLQRRLAALGVPTTVRVNAPCPHLVATVSEFAICY